MILINLATPAAEVKRAKHAAYQNEYRKRNPSVGQSGKTGKDWRKRLETPEECRARLMTRRVIDITTGCWLWTGAAGGVPTHRYGQTSYNGTVLPMHRLAGSLWNGWDIADKRLVCHKCDNTLCFNPEHLFQGTQGDNMRDMSAKGRSNSGRAACRNGHIYRPETTGLREGKYRICLECRRASGRRFDAKRRKAA